MNPYRFYAEMPEARGSKSASKKWAPFNLKTLNDMAARGEHNNCIAVLMEGGKPIWLLDSLRVEAFAAVTERSNSGVAQSSPSAEYLRKRCVRISAQLARQLHPNLINYLEQP